MTTSRDDAQPPLPDDPAGILTAARTRRAEADQAEADLLQLAVQWAITHPAESIEEAATIHLRSFGDTAIPVAGPGAPLVAEFSIAEYAAAIALPTEAGKRYLGHALELRYRLPRLWKRVTTGDLAAWKARRIADQTTHLTMQAAKYVDRHLAPVAHKVRPSQVDRLLDEAITRHMPEEAEERRRAAWDQRHLTINHHTADIAGTSIITGEIDLADALDLDQALTQEAQRMADLGNTDTLDHRRATAIGTIARRDLVLDYPTTHPTTDQPTTGQPAATRTPARRQVVLHLHLSEAAVRVPTSIRAVAVRRVPGRGARGVKGLGRGGRRRSQRLQASCGRRAAPATGSSTGEPPCGHDPSPAQRDPWCTRPARSLRPDEHPCDNDHPIPYDEGGPTCSCQIAPLCRRHHRLKTHGGWTYHVLEPGTYLWTSPHRYQYLRDHTGTLDVSRDKHRCNPTTGETPPTGET